MTDRTHGGEDVLAERLQLALKAGEHVTYLIRETLNLIESERAQQEGIVSNGQSEQS